MLFVSKKGKGAHERLFWARGVTLSFSSHFYHIFLIRAMPTSLVFSKQKLKIKVYRYPNSKSIDVHLDNQIL